MEVAPFRALTHLHTARQSGYTRTVEMEVAPFRALTPHKEAHTLRIWTVEMEVAPFRALTHSHQQKLIRCPQDLVEMEVAPFRALTRFYDSVRRIT